MDSYHTDQLIDITYSSGQAHSPGTPSDQDSHRGELTGLLGAMMDIKRLCTEFEITLGGVTIACERY
jgi:hypothetical protein